MYKQAIKKEARGILFDDFEFSLDIVDEGNNWEDLGRVTSAIILVGAVYQYLSFYFF